jgi:hypothetical protein
LNARSKAPHPERTHRPLARAATDESGPRLATATPASETIAAIAKVESTSVVDVPLSRQSRPSASAIPIDNPIIVHTGFALEYSTLYLTPQYNGELPSEEPVRQFVPLVEFQFDSPLNDGYGTATAATMNPGLAYVGETFQVSAEAIVPLNRAGGSSGFRAGVLFFLDDLIPALFGKPLFH